MDKNFNNYLEQKKTFFCLGKVKEEIKDYFFDLGNSSSVLLIDKLYIIAS